MMPALESQKEKILNSLNAVLRQDIQNTLLIAPSEDKAFIHGIPRLVINFKGNQNVRLYKNNSPTTIELSEGTWSYCTANGYLVHDWSHANESISLSYYGDYIRAMHIIYDGITQPPTERDIFYHADHSISQAGQRVLQALDELSLSHNYAKTSPYLLKALLQISIEDIERSVNNSAKYNANHLWMTLNAYIRAHRTESINRKDVSRHFNISPGYISHLFQSFSHSNFSETLLILRLEHAAKLLQKTNLTIDVVSDESGFNYTSYFIKRFKKYYGMTPHVYRNTKQKINDP